MIWLIGSPERTCCSNIWISPGQTVVICGPSGCGKSTLLSILAGWEKPYHGTVERKNVERVGWVFQNPYGVPGRTALDHVVFPLLAKGLRRREAEPQALEAMGLFDLEYAADRRFSELSGGEAQRVKLATELSRRDTGKTFYVLDEPTTGLHVADVQRLLDILQRLADGGSTVVVIEHNLDVIKCADYIIDMGPEGGAGGGTVIAKGTPEEVAKVKESYTGQYLAPILHRDAERTKRK